MERGWGRLRDREGGVGVGRVRDREGGVGVGRVRDREGWRGGEEAEGGEGRMTFTEHFTLYKAIGSEKYVNFEIFVLY